MSEGVKVTIASVVFDPGIGSCRVYLSNGAELVGLTRVDAASRSFDLSAVTIEANLSGVYTAGKDDGGE